jgi:hypothetical protein
LTIDKLLEGIEALRAQKEEMEKKEKAMRRVLRRKAERLNQWTISLDGDRLEPQLVPRAVGPTIAR